MALPRPSALTDTLHGLVVEGEVLGEGRDGFVDGTLDRHGLVGPLVARGRVRGSSSAQGGFGGEGEGEGSGEGEGRENHSKS